MTQTTILAAGTTAATSTDVVLAADAPANIVGYVATGSYWPEGLSLQVVMDSPSTNPDTPVGTINPNLLDDDGNPRSGVKVSGPGTYRVIRPACTQSVGAFSET